MLIALALVNVCAFAENTAPKTPSIVRYIQTFDEETDPHMVAVDITERVTRYVFDEKSPVVATGSAPMAPTFAKLLPALMCIPGVERAELDGYTIFVHKGRVFDWPDLWPKVIAAIQQTVAPKAEWREMVSKFPLRLEKMVTELNATPPQ